MNRELKFRAWHTEQKRMIEVYGLGKDFLTENTFDGVDPGTNAFCGDDMNFLKVMQYTGLKDKNGTECYEDDLSIISGNLCRVKFDVYFFSGWCFEIIGKPGSYTFNDVCKSFNEIGCLDFEVLGNFHQHPELLTHKQ